MIGMPLRLRRWSIAAIVLWLLAASGAIAHAAPDGGVTLGSLRVVGSHITGTLTVRGVPT